MPVEVSVTFEDLSEEFADLEKKTLYSESKKEKEDYISHDFSFDGIQVLHIKRFLRKATRINISAKQSIVQLKFNLTRQNSYYENGVLLSKIPAKHHNLFYLANKNDFYSVVDAGAKEIFVINMPIDFFFSNCPQVMSGFLDFRNKVRADETAFLTPNGMPINLKIGQIIYDIIHSEHPPYLRHVYLRAKVIELLSLQLEQCEKHDYAQGPESLKAEEIQRMETVKKLIEDQYDKDHSLIGLARAVGTNDATLKKHFKMAFGCTVFSHLTAVRMQRAKDMLGEKNAKILHIANHIGYKHASHFSAAFKKHFGYLPTAFKD